MISKEVAFEHVLAICPMIAEATAISHQVALEVLGAQSRPPIEHLPFTARLIIIPARDRTAPWRHLVLWYRAPYA